MPRISWTILPPMRKATQLGGLFYSNRVSSYSKKFNLFHVCANYKIRGFQKTGGIRGSDEFDQVVVLLAFLGYHVFIVQQRHFGCLLFQGGFGAVQTHTAGLDHFLGLAF